MLKKLVLLVSVLLVGYFLYYGFQQMKIAQEPEANLYSQLPASSILVLEIKDFSGQWNTIEANNIVWEELHIFSGIQNLKRVVRSIDSTIQTGPYSYMNNLSLIFSLIPQDKDTYAGLVQLKKPSKIQTNQVLSFLQSSLKMKKLDSSTDTIYHLSNSTVTLFISEKDGILSFSNHLKVIENLRSTKTLLDNNAFLSVKKTSSKNAKSRLFLQPIPVLASLASFGSDHTQLQISTLPNTSSWTEMDVDIKPDEISMGGFAFASDSLKHWISIFKNQEAMPLNVAKFLPNRTAFFIQFGFSDFKKMRSKMAALASNRIGSDFNYPIHQWDSIYEISIESDFLDWVDNEIALSIAEPEQMEIKSEGLVWVNSSDARTLIDALSNMALKVDNFKGLELQQIPYKDYLIQKLNIPGFLETCLGSPFAMITENYFLQLDDYVVFSNSPATLQWCVDRYANGKTLENDDAYQSFSERISDKSNIFLFSNISKSPEVFKHITSNPMKIAIEKNLELLKKFQGISLQMSYESDELYYVNNYLKYNPVDKKMPNTLWEAPINTACTFKPVILINHYTQGKEIFIQDTANTIYLIDNKGKILWNRKVSGKILSEVKQIDMYKNNKLQIIFNTEDHIYIIDRNGNNVSNFPVILTQKASAGLLVADYDNTYNYRLLVPTKDGNIKNYTIEGKPTKGWLYLPDNNLINQSLQFLRVKGRDYLMAIYANGKIKAINRRGEIRIEFDSQFNHSINGTIYMEPGSNLNSSSIFALTASQGFVKISLDDQKTLQFSLLNDSIEYFDFTSIDGDYRKELLVYSGNKLSAYTEDGQQIFSFSVRNKVEYTPYVYSFKNGQYYGLASFSDNKIMLLDQQGESISPFPLKGASPFTITDINNDGRLNVITTDKDGVVLNYTIN